MFLNDEDKLSREVVNGTLICLYTPILNIHAISGECPDGHKEGDTWPWGDYCGECSCHVGYWACVS